MFGVVVTINMALLTELGGPLGHVVAINMALLTELEGHLNTAFYKHGAPDGAWGASRTRRDMALLTEL